MLRSDQNRRVMMEPEDWVEDHSPAPGHAEPPQTIFNHRVHRRDHNGILITKAGPYILNRGKRCHDHPRRLYARKRNAVPAHHDDFRKIQRQPSSSATLPLISCWCVEMGGRACIMPFPDLLAAYVNAELGDERSPHGESLPNPPARRLPPCYDAFIRSFRNGFGFHGAISSSTSRSG